METQTEIVIKPPTDEPASNADFMLQRIASKITNSQIALDYSGSRWVSLTLSPDEWQELLKWRN